MKRVRQRVKVNNLAEEVATNKKKLRLIVTTPRGVKFEEEADFVVMRAIDGERGVLPGHERIFTPLGDGILRYINDGVERRLAVFGGLAEIDGEEVKIFTTIAQEPHEIDLERAEADRIRAEKALYQKPEDINDIRSAQLMIRRALVRSEVVRRADDDETED